MKSCIELPYFELFALRASDEVIAHLQRHGMMPSFTLYSVSVAIDYATSEMAEQLATVTFNSGCANQMRVLLTIGSVARIVGCRFRVQGPDGTWHGDAIEWVGTVRQTDGIMSVQTITPIAAAQVVT